MSKLTKTSEQKPPAGKYVLLLTTWGDWHIGLYRPVMKRYETRSCVDGALPEASVGWWTPLPNKPKEVL